MGTGDGRWERHGRGDEQSRGGDRTRNKNVVENLGWTEAVDMTAVQCVVGQVKVSGDGLFWTLVGAWHRHIMTQMRKITMTGNRNRMEVKMTSKQVVFIQACIVLSNDITSTILTD
jgi:hypothetical protein